MHMHMNMRIRIRIARRWDRKTSIDGKHQDSSSMDFDDGLISILVKDSLRTTKIYMHQRLR